jgi:RimJ/RimL family protein N-acetyltransferase
MRIPVLTTERLLIRELDESDLAAVERLLGPGRERWLRWTALSYGEYADLLQPPYGERAVTLREDGRPIGAIGLVPALGPFGLLPSWPDEPAGFRPEVGLFYEIEAGERRKGYAHEAATALVQHAFLELGLGRVIATTTHDNEASIGVMRRLGMRIERNPREQPAWFQVVGVLDAMGRPA